jgi:hypothetical protein
VLRRSIELAPEYGCATQLEGLSQWSRVSEARQLETCCVVNNSAAWNFSKRLGCWLQANLAGSGRFQPRAAATQEAVGSHDAVPSFTSQLAQAISNGT